MNEARDKPVYYSDLIKDNQIKTWLDNNDYIYLNGDTGTGKTTFVFTRLIDYALTYTGKHIFLLSNRKLLTQQHRAALKKYGIDTMYYELNGFSINHRLSIMTYQAFFEIYIKKNDIELQLECGVINGDDYIFILDECHYFLTDHWNNTTYKTLNTILKFSTATFFISATGNNVINYVNQVSDKKITPENTIPIPQNYSNITLKSIKDNTKHRREIVKLIYHILDNTSDKIMYYYNNTDVLCSIADELKIVYDPEKIKVCYSPSDEHEHTLPSEKDDALTENNTINGRCILTTKIIDNGIDIYDDDLKHLIIDLSESETIIQAIGRKRTKTPLTVYINETSKTILMRSIAKKEYKLHDSKKPLNALLKYQYNIMIQDYKTFYDNSVISVIYDKLKHTKIKLDKDDKYSILLDYLDQYAANQKPIDKDYIKSLLADIGIKAKQINMINQSFRFNNIPYELTEKRKRINGNRNASNIWYVSRL